KKNNFATGISGGFSNSVNDDPFALFFSLGYERIIGEPLKDGFFYALELRFRPGVLLSSYDYSPIDPDILKYNNKLLGLSIAFRPYLEIQEDLFLYIEGEAGYMYQFINLNLMQPNGYSSSPYTGNTCNFLYGVQIGVRYDNLAFHTGIFTFDSRKAINKLIPKHFNYATNKFILGEFGGCFYF
ncbi:MAG: hypothetical protein LBD53_09570, partial [Tannerella sp.]|nr:hypothetical protein [Tannerella sp.]